MQKKLDHNCNAEVDHLSEKWLDSGGEDTLLRNSLEEFDQGDVSNESSDHDTRPITVSKHNGYGNVSQQQIRLDRRVSFADSLGLQLTSIRLMNEGRDTPPDLSKLLHIAEQNQSKPAETLEAQFEQPIQNFNKFYSFLGMNNVALESVSVIEDTINGVIKVRNLAFEKEVTVHYTYDNWRSVEQCQCHYINPTTVANSSTTNTFDTFVFQIVTSSSWLNVEFCIEYKCQGQTLWDNNNRNNYLLLRNRLAPD